MRGFGWKEGVGGIWDLGFELVKSGDLDMMYEI